MPGHQHRIDGIKYEKSYPLLDSETNEPVPGLEKVYFDAKIHYRTLGKKQEAVPIDIRGLRQIFSTYHEPMSEDLARSWIYSRLKAIKDPISFEHMHLEELILGMESKGLGSEEVHTLRAKRSVYCKTS